MTTTHSKLDSPSAADRTEACPGSVALTMYLPDERSVHSDAGTLCHWLSAMFLSGELTCEPSEYLTLFPQGGHQCPDVSPDMLITQDMCDIAQYYVDYVRREAEGADLFYVEARVAMNASLCVESGAEGTADCIIFFPGLVKVIDLKAGFTPVDPNTSQLKRYALGARETFSHMLDGTEVFKLAIVQPKLDFIGEIELTWEELDGYQHIAAASASDVRTAIEQRDDAQLTDEQWEKWWLNPGEKQCRWCKAKAWCPALAKASMETIEDVPPKDMEAEALGVAMAKVGMVEDWCKAVRAAVEGALIQGRQVPGFKLVQGRRGPRAWSDEAEAERLMKEKFRLKNEDMYEFKLFSPTKAEKVLGEQPKRWAQLEKLIVQSDGKPSVAPESDKRPALSMAPSADGMEEIVETADDLVG